MADIFFKSPEHQQRLLAAMQQLGKVWENGRLDPEYASALYILSADTATWNQAQAYVRRSGIDFEAMLAEIDFSSGYAVLINLAWNLFNDGQKLNVLDFLRLDEGNFNVALSALQLRRHSMSERELMQKEG